MDSVAIYLVFYMQVAVAGTAIENGNMVTFFTKCMIVLYKATDTFVTTYIYIILYIGIFISERSEEKEKE